MDKYLDEYIDNLKASGIVAQNTIKAYESDLKNFIGSAELSNVRITQTSIMGYLLMLQKQGKSPATISRNLVSIKGFIGFLYNKNILDSDIAKAIKVPKSEKKPYEILTGQEIKVLLDMPPTFNLLGMRDIAMMELIYATGIKATELIALKLSDISLEYKYVKIGAKIRIVPLHQKACDSLATYINEARDSILKGKSSSYLFVNYNGSAMSRQGLWKIIGSYGKQANISKEVTPELLRQSFAVHMAREALIW